MDSLKVNSAEIVQMWYDSLEHALAVRDSMNDDWVYNQRWVEYTATKTFAEMVTERLKVIPESLLNDYIKCVIRVAFHAQNTIKLKNENNINKQ